MSKHEKTLQKLTAEPTLNSIKWSDLKGALESLGYELINGSGSRRKFVHKETKVLISCHEPHPKPEVKPYIIRQIAEHLKAQGFI